MITLNHPIYYLARITIECQSPLSIKADESDPTLDVTLFRDAHGNPTIAGTSIAGVLRHLAIAQGLSENLFGKLEPKNNSSQNNHSSRVQTSFGFVHDASNQPYMGSLHSHLDSQPDELIDFLSDVSPILRDQVALTQYGAAQDQGKFDVSALPKGTRFTFELGLSAEQQNQPLAQTHWQQLLNLVYSPLFRLGSLTHRGFGQLSVIALTEKKFDFTQPQSIKDWKQWQNSPWKPQTTNPSNLTSVPCQASQTLTLKLQAEDFWRIGEGSTPMKNYSKDPDAKPYTESIIEWKNDQATIKYQQLSVPATGIKGALRHRTLFHLRKLQQDWSGTIQDKDLAPLFGIKASHQDSQGNVGAIFINDIYPVIHKDDLSNRVKVMMHNAIDRFTGGTLKGALFSEELIYKGSLDCTLILDKNRFTKIDPLLINAFICALQDLGEGRLALGAGSAKGHGYFTMSNLPEISAQLQKIKEAQA